MNFLYESITGQYGRKVVEETVSDSSFTVFSSGNDNGQPKRGSCYVDVGNSYQGTRSETGNPGASECQNWKTQTVHRNYNTVTRKMHLDEKYNKRDWNHNYCQNPGGDEQGPWCMTTNYYVKQSLCLIA